MASSYGPKNLISGIALLVVLLISGTVGYMIIEKWHFLNALYMTVITITTVGYGEVSEVSQAGRIFTIVLIFVGAGIVAYILGLVAQSMLDFQLRSILGGRKLGLKTKMIKNHYIICGYGRIGKVISQELKASRIPILVVDNSDSANALNNKGIPHIIDDATVEDVLIEAGIEKAKGLISVVSSDADNLFITMTARGLCPELFILARANEEHTHKKLLRAGANRAVMPHLIGGQKMAHTILKPAVTEFLELTIHDRNIELEMEELRVGAGSSLISLSLMELGIRQKMNVIIVAIKRKDGETIFNPSSQTRIESEDTLIALGYDDDLERLSSMLSGL